MDSEQGAINVGDGQDPGIISEESSADDPKVAPPAGSTSIDTQLELEILIATLAALRHISADIAAGVHHWIGGADPQPAVVIAREEMISRLADWHVLAMRIDVLAVAMRDVLRYEKKPQRALEGLETIPLEPITQVTAGVQAVAHLLSFFKADTTYEGRTVEVDEALLPALAGQLLAHGIEPMVLTGAALTGPHAPGSNLLDSWREMLILREQVAALLLEHESGGAAGSLGDGSGTLANPPSEVSTSDDQAAEMGEVMADQPTGSAATGGAQASETIQSLAGEGEDATSGGAAAQVDEKRRQGRIASLVKQVDGLVDSFGEGKAPSLSALLQASEVAALAETPQGAFLLTARVVRAGGHYRTRKHLFTTLFTGDQLSYSGGAAVAFSLIDLKRMSTVLSDVLFHATGNLKFPEEQAIVSPSNLRSGGSGFAPLNARPRGAGS